MGKKVKICIDLANDPTGCSYYIEFIPTESDDFETINALMREFKKMCMLHDFQVVEAKN